jgi:predicted DNA-binding transcriptional regulator YafY
MRADRLVAILLMLQARDVVTAAEVAAELEVSERTARRDLEALGMAGVPVYPSRGRGGGWRLLGRGRTDLSGLNAAEVRALFLTAGPHANTAATRAALRKLVRALPEPFRAGAEAAAEATVVEPPGWDNRATPAARQPPLLEATQRVVVDGLQAQIVYTGRNRARTTRVVHPLGLAAKGSTWYLISDTADGLRTFRVDRIEALDALDAPSVRPEGFVLADAWADVVSEVNARRHPARAGLVVQFPWVDLLRWRFGTRLSVGGPVEVDGFGPGVSAEVRGQSERSLAGELAGLGALVVVVDPPSLRARLAGIGEELVDLYGPAARWP